MVTTCARMFDGQLQIRCGYHLQLVKIIIVYVQTDLFVVAVLLVLNLRSHALISNSCTDLFYCCCGSSSLCQSTS